MYWPLLDGEFFFNFHPVWGETASNWILPRAKSVSNRGMDSSANTQGTEKVPFTPTRRSVLRAGAAGAAVSAASLLSSRMSAHAEAAAAASPDGGHQVFQHGVASGDPLPDSVLLWTRVTSHPGDIPGAEAGRPVNLTWEVASDEGFTAIITRGTATAEPDRDNTVKVDATGLPVDSWMYYRFIVADGDYAGQVSPTGRTRTAPAPNSSPDHLGIGLTSCANWESGYFSAYRDMANNDQIDIIMCVGDYIYEYEQGGYAGKFGIVREHQPAHEIVSLSDYRLRYGTYHTDSDLQEAHRTKPWIVTWDDHEVANDTYSTGAENHDPETEGDFNARRANAIQAYLEWLPVRAVTFSEGGHLYRNFHYGDLAEITMLDLRTYRDQPPKFVDIKDVDDTSRTMLGSEQFNWLHQQLQSSSAQWNLMGNSVMFTPVLIPPLDPDATRAVTELLGIPEEGIPYNSDQWDGFAAERRKLIKIISDEGYDNVVFLTGDIHSSWACDVPREVGKYPNGGVAAAEIVCTSVTSSNIDDIVRLPQDNPISLAATAGLKAANRHVKYLEFDRHGYVAVHVGRDEIIAEYRLVEVKEEPNQPLFVAATYRVERGKGISPA